MAQSKCYPSMFVLNMCFKSAISKLNSKFQMSIGMILDKLASPSFVGVV